MARRAENVFFNKGLQGIIDNCNKMVVCNAEPTNYTEANATFAIANVAMVGGDYTEADGDVSGRKLTVAAKTVTGTATDTGTHLALIDTTGTALYYVTTIPAIAITNTVTQDLKAWDIELLDPAAP